MGHSTVQMTLDRYGHLFPELDAGIALSLDETFRTTLASAGAKGKVAAIDARR